MKKKIFEIFAIHSSSRHEKRCQISVRLFSLFRGSIYQHRAVAKWVLVAPPIFGRSANPILTRGDTLSSPSTTSPPGISDLATALQQWKLSTTINCYNRCFVKKKVCGAQLKFSKTSTGIHGRKKNRLLHYCSLGLTLKCLFRLVLLFIQRKKIKYISINSV